MGLVSKATAATLATTYVLDGDRRVGLLFPGTSNGEAVASPVGPFGAPRGITRGGG